MATHMRRTLAAILLIALVGIVAYASPQFLRGSVLSDPQIAQNLKNRADTNADGTLTVREIRKELVKIIRDVIMQKAEGDINGDNVTNNVDTSAAITGFRSLLTAECGNGSRDAGEACDDANVTSGDGCSATCATESDFSCSGEPSVCLASQASTKDMSRYSDKSVFLMSDANDWKDILMTIPATVWTGNESCQKGYLTPDNVCVYPMLLFHEKEPLTHIPLRDNSQGPYAVQIFNDGRPVHHQKAQHPDFEPCALDHPSMNSLWLRDFRYVEEEAERGDTIHLEAHFQNCAHTAKVIDELRYNPTCGGETCGQYFGYGNDFDGKINTFPERVIEPGESAVVAFDLTFQQQFIAGLDVMPVGFFLQDYEPSKINVIGNFAPAAKQQLTNAGMAPSLYHPLTPDDILDYWQEYSTVIFSQDDYATALVATTYASLQNSPLVVERSRFDTDQVLSGKTLICVGNVSTRADQCDSTYSVAELQQRYIALTQTDKMMITNPRDLQEFLLSKYLNTDDYSTVAWDAFARHSLAAPILASARHEALFSVTSSDVEEIDDFIEDHAGLFDPMKFLTIFSNPELTPMTFHDIEPHRVVFRSADFEKYGQTTTTNQALEFATGRITGLSAADGSAYVARSLFYDKTLASDTNMAFLQFGPTPFTAAENPDFRTVPIYGLKEIFSGMGYDAVHADSYTVPDMRALVENAVLTLYYGHGGENGLVGMSLPPRSHGTFMMANACQTCAYNTTITAMTSLSCLQVLRHGAIGYVGDVFPASGFDFSAILSELYSDDGSSLGEALATAKAGYINGAGDTHVLLGDPILKLKRPVTLPDPKLTLIRTNNGVQEYEIEAPVIMGEVPRDLLVDPDYIERHLGRKEYFSSIFGLWQSVTDKTGRYNFPCFSFEVESAVDALQHPVIIQKDSFLGKCQMWINADFLPDVQNVGTQVTTVRKRIFVTPKS